MKRVFLGFWDFWDSDFTRILEYEGRGMVCLGPSTPEGLPEISQEMVKFSQDISPGNQFEKSRNCGRFFSLISLNQYTK